MRDIIIGLTGRRQVGKSTISKHLVEQHGFTRLHPFEGGKVACRAYFMHCGASSDEASRMTDGDLKDRPSAYLPQQASPRYFMEKFGKFMGNDMGPDWTIGREIERARQGGTGQVRLVIESIVYEVDTLRAAGGMVIKVERPGTTITGLETDRFVEQIVPDRTILNDGADTGALIAELDALVEERMADDLAYDF